MDPRSASPNGRSSARREQPAPRRLGGLAVVAVLAAAFLPPGSATVSATTAQETVPARMTLDSDFARELDGFIRELMEVDLAPGLSVAVIRGDETLFLGGYGWADIETRRPVT
ncbi:MAG: hypothetical protein R3266_11960, partial [Gemmatimonadota bacterium]|nr:hypothetical protein [Gemmatimonadota bacterium]